ncbi:MlaD family protein [Actinocorallia longicatena]|uniref:MCE family protein n=1 Tax=Actinocorallia longicatena TaxID=111803 RepID=A0ABP6Q0D6_9ACTN
MKRLVAAAAALLVVTASGGCSVVGGGGTYKLTVYFAKTPSLYEQSRVKVLGANVGTIDKIDIDEPNNRVKVTLSVKDSVPVPNDVHAAILSASTIGERNIILYPPWKPGMAKANDGHVIQQDQTDLPVEIDDALAAFTSLAKNVDPTRLRDTFKGGADLLRDNGKDINHAVQTLGTFTDKLAAQDQRIVNLATKLNDLAGSLNRRDQKLKALFNAFNSVGGQLADERNRMQAFLSGLESIITQGDVLVQNYNEKLPSTIANVSEIVMTLKANSASVALAIKSFSTFTDTVVKAYDQRRHVITVRLQLNAITRAWLQPIFDAMNWGPVPCTGKPFGNCKGTIKKSSTGKNQGKNKKAGAP